MRQSWSSPPHRSAQAASPALQPFVQTLRSVNAQWDCAPWHRYSQLSSSGAFRDHQTTKTTKLSETSSITTKVVRSRNRAHPDFFACTPAWYAAADARAESDEIRELQAWPRGPWRPDYSASGVFRKRFQRHFVISRAEES